MHDRHPLFRTIARTDRVPDIPHRPGNVRDPGGADIPVDRRTGRTRRRLPRTGAGTRIDGAFPNKPSPDDRIR